MHPNVRTELLRSVTATRRGVSLLVLRGVAVVLFALLVAVQQGAPGAQRGPTAKHASVIPEWTPGANASGGAFRPRLAERPVWIAHVAANPSASAAGTTVCSNMHCSAAILPNAAVIREGDWTTLVHAPGPCAACTTADPTIDPDPPRPV